MSEDDPDSVYKPSVCSTFEPSVPFDQLGDSQKKVCYHVLESVVKGDQVKLMLFGGGGTDKSECIKTMASGFVRMGKKTGVCATSGNAAVLLGGQTVHGLFGLPMDLDVSRLKPAQRNVLKSLDAVIFWMRGLWPLII